MAYNILIVDDEPAITNGLAYDIDWAAIGILEVFKANNVPAALEYLRHNKIDVVVTDIRMPEMDGLELAGCIRRQWKYAKTIFISGYDEFEYAQKAIDLGVFSYITKPISNQRLLDTVARALREIEEELDNTRLIADTRQAQEELLPVVRERTLLSWILKGRPLPRQDRLQQMGIHLEEDAFLTLVSLDGWQGPPDEYGFALELTGMIENILFPVSGSPMHFMDHDDNLVIVAGVPRSEGQSDFLRYVKGMAEPFQEAFLRATGHTASIFFGNAAPPEAMHEEYNRLLKQARLQRYWKPGLIMEPEQIARGPEQKGLALPQMTPAFAALLESHRFADAQNHIRSLFSQIAGPAPQPNNAALQILFTVVGALFSDSARAGLPIDPWCGGFRRRLTDMQWAADRAEAEKLCLEMTDAYLRHLASLETGRTSKLVDQVKRYAEQNINKEITVADIASHLHLHPNYLLRLFKEETGQAVIDYLISVRIRMAKALLANDGVKIYEVAERVGYDSVSHFSRIFKRETGLSPKDFQQQCGQ